MAWDSGFSCDNRKKKANTIVNQTKYQGRDVQDIQLIYLLTLNLTLLRRNGPPSRPSRTSFSHLPFLGQRIFPSRQSFASRPKSQRSLLLHLLLRHCPWPATTTASGAALRSYVRQSARRVRARAGDVGGGGQRSQTSSTKAQSSSKKVSQSHEIWGQTRRWRRRSGQWRWRGEKNRYQGEHSGE